MLSEEEEKSVKWYCLWQSDRGMPVNMQQMKAIIRDIHQRAINSGKKRATINIETGPSRKYMRSFFKRHRELTKRQAETVDRGRINMANDGTVKQYFDLLKRTLVKLGIAELGEDGSLVNEQCERLYLADETGWGSEKKSRKVVGRKNAPHAYVRKPSDESHKTLMLEVRVC